MAKKNPKKEEFQDLINLEEKFSFLEIPETLLEELNILRMEGRLFCFDPKKAKQNVGVFAYEERDGRELKLTFSPEYGQPSVLAYRVLQAIFKKLTEEGMPFETKVSFSQREMSRLIGRSVGGRQSTQLYDAIQQLFSTQIRGSIKNKETGTWQELSFTLFPRVLMSGREAKINECLVQVNDIIIDSLNARHWACFNWERLQTLEPIGMAIYKRLHWHFSNLYGHKLEQLQKNNKYSELSIRQARKEIVFEKDYQDICNEWLGGLVPKKYKSQIKQKLGDHLKSVKLTSLTRKWSIENKARGGGFKLVFHPGMGFFRDYEQFYLQNIQPQFKFNQRSAEITIQQPLEVVSYFHRKLTGSSVVDISFISRKETELAAKLLDQFGKKAVEDLVNYAVAEAKRTDFNMKTFGAVKQYVTPWQQSQKSRAADSKKKDAQAKRVAVEALEDQYRRDRNAHVLALEGSLSETQKTKLTKQAERLAKTESPEDSLLTRKVTVRLIRNRLLLQKKPYPSFEDWKKSKF